MAVNWLWKNKKGYLILVQDNKKFKINIYGGNCLGALIYEWKDENTKDNMYQFYAFWNDEKHLKKILGLVKGYDNLYTEFTKIKLNSYFKDMVKIAPLFAKVGIKVELYYKEIK